MLEATRESQLAQAPASITKPRLLALLLSDYASTSEDGKFSVMGIFDRIVVPKLPSQTTQFYLYFRLAETLDGPVEILRESPSGVESGQMALPQASDDLGDEHPVFLQGMVRMSFLARESGIHWFVVRFAGEELGRAPVAIAVGNQSNGSDQEHSEANTGDLDPRDGDPAAEAD